MVKYPVKVYPQSYKGHDKKKLSRFHNKVAIAKGIENYINEAMTDVDQLVFTYEEIAEELNVSLKTVIELLLPLGGGNTGITVFNPKSTSSQILKK